MKISQKQFSLEFDSNCVVASRDNVWHIDVKRQKSINKICSISLFIIVQN